MEELCPVCNEPLDEIYAVTCVVCGRKVHFHSSELPGDDCCQVVTQFGACGLSFMCNPCAMHVKAQER